MPDNEVNILIKFGLEKNQAEEAVRQLRGLRSETAAVKPVAADLSKTLDELHQNTRGTAKGVGDLTLKKEEFKKVLHLLPGPLREIGSLLKAAFSNPIVAAAIALATGVRLIAEGFTKLHESVKTADIGNRLSTAMEDASNAVTLALNPWKNLANAINTAKDAAGGYSETIANIQEAAKFADDEAEATHRLAQAKLDAARASGQITEAEYKQRSLLLESSRDQMKATRDEKTGAAIIAAKKSALADAQAQSGGLASGLYDATQRRAGIEGGITKANADIAKLEELRKQRGYLTPEENGLLYQRRAFVTSATEELAGAKSAESQAQGALNSNNATITSLSRDIPRLEISAAAANASRNRILATDVQTRGIIGATAGMAGIQGSGIDLQSGNARLLLDAAAGADAIRAGGRASSEQANAINAASGMLGLRGQSTEKILSILARINDNEKNFLQRLQDLEQRVSRPSP